MDGNGRGGHEKKQKGVGDASEQERGKEKERVKNNSQLYV